MRRGSWVLTGITSAAFIALSVIVTLGTTDAADKSARIWLHALAVDHLPFMNGFFVFVSTVASTPTLAMLCAVFTVPLMLRRHLDAALYLNVSAWGSFLLVHPLKELFARPRPDGWNAADSLNSFAYPSGHAMNSTAVIVTALVIIHCHSAPTNRTRIVSYVLAVTAIASVSVSRVWLGVHYPTDVLGGVLAGIAWSLLVSILILRSQANGAQG